MSAPPRTSTSRVLRPWWPSASRSRASVIEVMRGRCDPWAGSLARSCSLIVPARLFRRLVDGRQAHGEGGTAPFAVALGENGAAVRFHDAARDRQPEPQASGGPGVAFAKPLEDVRQKRRRDADALVADAHQ